VPVVELLNCSRVIQQSTTGTKIGTKITKTIIAEYIALGKTWLMLSRGSFVACNYTPAFFKVQMDVSKTSTDV